MKIQVLFSLRDFIHRMAWSLLLLVLCQPVLKNFRIRGFDQFGRPGRLRSSRIINCGNRWIRPIGLIFFCVILLLFGILSYDLLRSVLLWAIMDRRKSLFPKMSISSNENNMQHIKFSLLILSLTKRYNPCQYFKCMSSWTNKFLKI